MNTRSTPIDMDTADTVPPRRTVYTTDNSLRTREFNPPRRKWPGVLAACVLGAGIGAAAVSSFYDDRSVGEKIDATVAATQSSVENKVDDLKVSASQAAQDVARDSAQVSERAAVALSDAGITAAVKTALAADPRLSAVKIEVNTDAGVVSLQGPAPDDRSKERAEVLAAAPTGVLRVDNRLVVTGGGESLTR